MVTHQHGEAAERAAPARTAAERWPIESRELVSDVSDDGSDVQVTPWSVRLFPFPVFFCSAIEILEMTRLGRRAAHACGHTNTMHGNGMRAARAS